MHDRTQRATRFKYIRQYADRDASWSSRCHSLPFSPFFTRRTRNPNTVDGNKRNARFSLVGQKTGMTPTELDTTAYGPSLAESSGAIERQAFVAVHASVSRSTSHWLLNRHYTRTREEPMKPRTHSSREAPLWGSVEGLHLRLAPN